MSKRRAGPKPAEIRSRCGAPHPQLERKAQPPAWDQGPRATLRSLPGRAWVPPQDRCPTYRLISEQTVPSVLNLRAPGCGMAGRPQTPPPHCWEPVFPGALPSLAAPRHQQEGKQQGLGRSDNQAVGLRGLHRPDRVRVPCLLGPLTQAESREAPSSAKHLGSGRPRRLSSACRGRREGLEGALGRGRTC